MTTSTSRSSPPHRLCPVLFGLIVLTFCLALPRLTHPGFVPSEPQQVQIPTDPQTRSLLALVRHLDAAKTSEPTPQPDRHALRQGVTTSAVRLAVDPEATHPLAGRLAVRVRHLGAPGQRLRLVRLPEAQPPQTPTILQAEAPSPEPSQAIQTSLTPQTPQTAPAPEATQAPHLAARPASPEPTVKKLPPRPTVAPPPRPSLTEPGRSVLVAGDSLSIYLANALRPLLAGSPGLHFAAKGKVSSGLARPDFFDWEREMPRQSLAVKPDTVIIMIATNDNKTMTRPDGVKVAFGRRGWEAEYGRRVRRLIELARRGNPQARIYWVGAPVMGNPRLNADVAAINRVIADQLTGLPGCHFVDVRPTLADARGNYVAVLSTPRGGRPIRTKDGVHLQPYGARLLAEACLAAMHPTLAALP